MYKYDGLVVYQNHDDDGILEVVEENGIRSLHFGTSSRQSSLELANPDFLHLPYTRAMTSWLLFKESLQHALVIGLGGGSLARHLLVHFSDCKIKAVESRASVVKISRSHFGLPLNSRLKVIVEDGGHYVAQQARQQSEQHDLILVDAFDSDGLAGSIAAIAFFDACKVLLTPDGVLVINLWGSEKRLFDTCVQWLQQVFSAKVLLLPVRQRGNTIALAFNSTRVAGDMKTLKTRANELEQRYRIDFLSYLNDLRKHNPHAIQHFITR